MLSARLRNETRSHHLRLESRVDFLQPGLDRAAYVAMLTRLYGFHGPLENQIAEHLVPAYPDLMNGRRKADWILRDLAALGEPSNASVPLCPNLPAITDVGSALGAAYVLEGSTLGGGIMSKHFRESVGVTPDVGGSFFASYGDRIPQMWRAFLLVLDDWGSRNDGDVVVRSATETFDRFGDWFSEVKV